MSLCERCEHARKFRSIDGYYVCKALRGIVVKDRPVCYDYRRKEEKKA